MSKLQSALDERRDSQRHKTYYSLQDIKDDNAFIQAAQAELNDHLALLTSIRKHLAEYTMYPMNAKEAVEMLEDLV